LRRKEGIRIERRLKERKCFGVASSLSSLKTLSQA
jgi:hypothetical protein